MFLLNSHETHFFATSRTTSPVRGYGSRPPFFRSYGSRLPSSLARVLSRALVYSTRPPVSDYGTVTLHIHDEGFLGSVVKTTSPGLTPDRYHLSRLTTTRTLPTRSLYRLKPPQPTGGWSDLLRHFLVDNTRIIVQEY